MIKNYLKTTLQNIRKHKFFSIINILGLSVGIASSIFIAIYINQELSYDHFNKNGDRIYRVVLDAKLGEQIVHASSTPNKMANALRTESPSIENATTVQGWGSTSFLYEDKSFIEREAIVVDSSFLKVFTYPLLYGDRRTALKEPNSVVLTEELATKYFGNPADALGKLMVVDGDSISFKVTGVAENVPDNSHLKFTALLSKRSFKRLEDDPWINNNADTYFLLKENANVEQANEQLESIMQKYISEGFKQFIGSDVNELRQAGGEFRYTSEPLYKIHLYSSYEGGLGQQGDIKYIYILLAIGAFILLIACINFMNLSTAKSANRAKEVGLRKTMGATRGQLIGQFLTESMVFSIISALLALLFIYILMPYYNILTGKFLDMNSVFQPNILLMMFITVVLVGILAGSYPAFYLTSFEIVNVIKGKLNAGSKNKIIRGFLVTFQFWISIVLIISTAIVYMQLRYAQNKKIGIDKDRVLYVVSTFRLDDNAQAYKNALLKFPEIAAAGFTSTRFPGMNNNSVFRSKGDSRDHLLSNYFADYDHQKVMGFEMKEGRFFSRDFPTDSNAVVINEAAVKEMGWDNPLEQEIVSYGVDGAQELHPVIGVVKDFNYNSIKEEIRPLMIRFGEKGSSLAIRFNGKSYSDVINKAQEEWDKLVPDEPFEYSFMSDEFDAQFRSEQRLMQFFSLLTGLAIFIACLGLFGLTAFTAEQRTKEIGIRKALGASVWQINTLLTREFNKLVIIAFALAIFPVYYLMSGWLNNFAYRVSMGIWVFVMGGIVSLVISWVTVSFQAQKAARANPMEALKYE
ncbi:MAG: ABC transporter permease [Cyclobacteriaceae bacterium]|nr:ABC transporter permease [Cyclobacteriaceae bacterium]